MVGSCERPTLQASVFIPDLTEQGIEPNPGPPKGQASGSKGEPRAQSQQPQQASNKRKAMLVKKLIQAKVYFTPHQLRTLVNIDGACERLEGASIERQQLDI
eukprot:1891579-Amphidinium_carterae.1